MSDQPELCKVELPGTTLVCEGAAGHSGPHGWGDNRWHDSDVAAAVDELARRADGLQSDAILGSFLGERVQLVLASGRELSGVLIGWRELDGLPVLLRMQAHPLMTGPRERWVSWAHVELIDPQ
jgi:hypothetical protein